MAGLTFKQLNLDWNAEPNAPHVELSVDGDTVRVEFLLNPWAYDAQVGEVGILTFLRCSRWGWDSTNDHAWFAGEGLFSGLAPKWGEFYEVSGDTRPIIKDDWEIISVDNANSRQFLFYFRDDTLQMVAHEWMFERFGTTKAIARNIPSQGFLARVLNWVARW